MNSIVNTNLFFLKFKFVLVVLCFLSISPALFSQSNVNVNGKRVEIVHAEALNVDNKIGDGAKRLVGDVQFKQENTLMFCDSAYFYKDNSLDAFGHVHIQQPDDSTNLYGDKLNYNGNTKKAILTNNVVLDKGDMHLTTAVLNYNTSTRIADYPTPGRITNKQNVLTSHRGYFFGKTNDLTFKDSVVLTNPQFVINCDTMRYNIKSKIAYFKGPTTIKSKENLIYCEDGWYNTQKDLSRFTRNSYIVTNEQKMWGDSVFYDRKKGQGKALHHVQIIDTVQHLIITGDYATHDEFQDLSIVTGKPELMQIGDKDTLFLHGDTLKSIGSNKRKDSDTLHTKPFSIASDTVKTKDTTLTKLFVYHHVKFFRKDLQGSCDSIVYFSADSTMHLYTNPILWSDSNQLTGDSVWLVVGNKSLHTMELFGTAFIVSQEDSLRYNQIRGKYMKGFFKNNELYRVNVVGNGQTIYYVKEDEKIKSVNRADCTDLHIFLQDRQINKINFITRPDATLFPLDKVDARELKLKGFLWRADVRPAKREDIFKK